MNRSAAGNPMPAHDSSPDSSIPVEVVLAMPEVQYRVELDVCPGTTAREAVRLAVGAGLIPLDARVDTDPLQAPLGVYSEKVEDNYRCQAGDRVEIYRPLQQDPKDMRRQRARQST
ncbi:MAG: RnfH family protein [Granulosicoccus sp.]|nr:RnfH family protein [Granulosicoccus sp.]